MTATEILKKEHEAILQMLKILGQMCDRLESGQLVKVEHLEQGVDFIKGFADKCHHHKEEGLLFPKLEALGIPKEDGPIGMMLLEHDEGRNFVKGLSEGIAQYKAGQAEAVKVIAANARGYINLLSQHIDKENNILFMMADMHLSEADQQELVSGFDRVEQEEIGSGQHEKYHQMLNELAAEYLK